MLHTNSGKNDQSEHLPITKVCKECNGKGTALVDMGGPDIEVVCHHCGGSKLEPPSKQFH